MASAITRGITLDTIRAAAWQTYRRVTAVHGSTWYRPLVDIPAAYRETLRTADGTAWAILDPATGALRADVVTMGWPCDGLDESGGARVHDWAHALGNALYQLGIYYAWPGTFGDGWPDGLPPFWVRYGGVPQSYLDAHHGGVDPYADFRLSPFADWDGTARTLYGEVNTFATFAGLHYGTETRHNALLATIANLHTFGGPINSGLREAWQAVILDNPSPAGNMVCQSTLGESLHWRVYQTDTDTGAMSLVAEGEGVTYDTGIPLASIDTVPTQIAATFVGG